MAGDHITIKWESLGEGRFDIVMFDDGSCGGSQVADLCGKLNGCADSMGDYNVQIPASLDEGTCELN